MRSLHIPKLRKSRIFFVIIISLVLYLIFAYSFFNFKLRSAKLDWPNNRHTYHFNNSSPSKKTYVALGDSLTYGFGSDNYEDSYTYQLARYLSNNGQGVTLKDFSYPGNKTGDVLVMLDPTIAYHPDIITVLIGVNDTHSLFQPSDFTKNYDTILFRLTHETKAKIYVISIPYLGAKSILLPPYNYYFDAKIRAHNDEIKKLAQKYNVSYIDIYSPTVALFKKTGPQYSRDLYHPSAEGYKIWAGIIENDIHP